MSGLRINIDIYIPEDPSGKYVEQLDMTLPSEIVDNLTNFVKEIRRAKKYATKINEGMANEEMTIKATWHRCYHDMATPEPCVGQDI